MYSFFTKIFFSCFFIVGFFAANAQTAFFATVSPQVAGKDEYITLKLTVANGGKIEQISPPSFDDFFVVSGPNQESEMNSVNGVIKEYVSLSYVLLPKKLGNIHLGSSSAIIDGKKYKSAALAVSVNNKKAKGNNPGNNLQSLMQFSLAALDPFMASKPDADFDDYFLKKDESIPEKVSRNMQLKLHTDKTTCFVGESLVATYKLYTRLKSESSLSKNPSFNGFSVIDMTQNALASVTKEQLNGRGYNVYVIRKAQLYPLQAGAVELETATLDNKITFVKNDGDPNDFFGASSGTSVTENVSLSSKPVTITVKPLPEKGKPSGFNGAVGNFKMMVSLEKNNFSTDETGKLLITVSGKGNMQILTAPHVQWPAGIEAFDTKLTDNTDITGIPVSGSKTFEMNFAVLKEGDYITPAIVFSFFDPAVAAYKTVTSPPIKFTVTKGTGNAKSQMPVFSDKEKPNANTGNAWMLPTLVLSTIGFFVILFFGIRKKKTSTGAENATELAYVPADIPAAYTLPQNPLTKTEECIQRKNCEEFYVVLNSEIKSFLAEKFSLPKEMITAKNLMIAMDKSGVENAVILQTQQLLQDINLQLYTPFEFNDQLSEMYARAQTMIQLLNMQQA